MDNNEKPQDPEKFKEWEKTQLQWDDTDFLNVTATALMKKKWQRLNLIISKITEKEMLSRNEYISLLDIGAGRGDFYRLVQSFLKKYTGIEPSEKMLSNEVDSENFLLKKGSGETLNDSNEYDVCLIKEVLDHTYDPGLVIKNSYRALKDNGLLIVSLTNRDAFYKLIFKAHAKKLEIEHKDHLYNFNPAAVRTLMEAAGFTVEKNMSINYMKLPVFIENIVGRLPDKLLFFKLDVIDWFLSLFMAGKGGGFIMTGRKKQKGGTEQ
jgi:2-polyprenyl-3-methyl-5-hydroxy-6-metoxy-1,4-benzoquinol methylase